MRAVGAMWLLGMLALATVAVAQANDVVVLTNGGRLRGTVEVYEPDPEHIVDRYLVQIHDGRFEIVEQGRIEPVDWRVSADELRHLVAEGEAYVHAPQRLDLRWLEVRLGIVPRLTRAGTWRVGRVRRPSAAR